MNSDSHNPATYNGLKLFEASGRVIPADAGENVMPAVIDAVKAKATVGEICDVWRDLFGEYRPKEFV